MALSTSWHPTEYYRGGFSVELWGFFAVLGLSAPLSRGVFALSAAFFAVSAAFLATCADFIADSASFLRANFFASSAAPLACNAAFLDSSAAFRTVLSAGAASADLPA